MIAFAGQVADNAISLTNGTDLSQYNGRSVIVTILDPAIQLEKPKRKVSDMMSLVMQTELSKGQAADAYIKELRANDRL